MKKKKKSIANALYFLFKVFTIELYYIIYLEKSAVSRTNLFKKALFFLEKLVLSPQKMVYKKIKMEFISSK